MPLLRFTIGTRAKSLRYKHIKILLWQMAPGKKFYNIGPRKKRYNVSVNVSCEHGRNGETVSKESNSLDKLNFVFDKLDPNTKYTCRGVLVFDKVESFIPRIVVETLDGVPDKPEKVKVLQTDPDKMEITWETPVVSRGVVQEYLIQVFPKYDKDKVSDGVCGGDVRHEKEFGVVSFGGNVTQAWLNNLLPATAYDVTVSAKTRHKEAGEYQICTNDSHIIYLINMLVSVLIVC